MEWRRWSSSRPTIERDDTVADSRLPRPDGKAKSIFARRAAAGEPAFIAKMPLDSKWDARAGAPFLFIAVWKKIAIAEVR